MADNKYLTEKPIFFERNRVFRIYLGGKLFHDFFGDKNEDSMYPEEWVASDVLAKNEKSAGPDEGLSFVRGTHITFKSLLEDYKSEMLGNKTSFGMLVKLLDSAIRLPVQAHPDKAYSMEHFNSTYGKAESWIIIATRPDAHIYFGFKEKLTKEEFKAAIELSKTNRDAMVPLLNRVDVKTGDVFMIPAKVVHAIGAGCLLLEVQEPTDFTIGPEYWCGDYELSKYEMYLGLDEDIALDCFDYEQYGPGVVERNQKKPKTFLDENGVLAQELITFDDTPCFAVNRWELKGGKMTLDKAARVYVVTNGSGEIKQNGEITPIKKGDYFFIPAAAKGCVIESGDIEIMECIPPQK